MAKNDAKSVHVKAARPKTAAELKRAEDNRQKAAERLKELQAKQKLANEIKKTHGITGRNPDDIIAKFEEQNRQPSPEQKAADFINLVTKHSGIAGRVAEKWLGNRMYKFGPLKVKELLETYLAYPQNRWIAEAVEISKVAPLNRAA